MSLSSHQKPTRGKSVDWLTPPEIVKSLGPFDLDPCCPENMPWRTATEMLTKADDGLSRVWDGFVWMNPPYGDEVSKWMGKMVRHNNGIALVPARTETRWCFGHVWPSAQAVLFLRGRPHFHYPDGKRAPYNSGAPIMLVAYGLKAEGRLHASRNLGRVVNL